ncbi:polysaccharide deacetylase family protein [bacterium]|nr:polysaccharide deacetylase family protein [bacterium]
MMRLNRIAPFFAWGWKIRTERPGTIAITFDDGPDPRTTPFLLRVLDDLQLKCTMFVIGQKCIKQAALLREISSAGHHIACHGFVHTRHSFRTAKFLLNSINQTQITLAEAGVSMAKAFRAPYGSIDLSTHLKVTKAGLQPVLWSVHIADWKASDSNILLSRTRRVLHDQMILLLHDGHPASTALGPTLHFLKSEIEKRRWLAVPLPETSRKSEAC